MAITIPERFPRLGPMQAEALARLMAMRGAMGITRIADITGLDRLGIPVMQAVRPFSLSNAVSQGKGADATSAAVSAMLESAESFFAERVASFETTVASARALQVPCERFSGHLLEDSPPDWYDRETAWVSAVNLLSGATELVPFELVHTAYINPPLPHGGIFAASTTGLAASFLEEDAIAHGMLECIERDAIARAHRVHGFLQRSRIDPATLDHPAIRELLEILKSKGMLVGLWHARSPTGVPVIWCQLMEDGTTESALLPFPADGSAASLDPAAAITHAIYEAAQARLAAISGARDDITRAFYPKYPDWEMIAAHRRLLADGPRPLSFGDVEGQEIKSGELIENLLSRLAEGATSNVFVVRIETAPLSELAVVRIIIPDLQPLLHG
jgi:YcaO-like protein with predicted kinase domain